MGGKRLKRSTVIEFNESLPETISNLEIFIKLNSLEKTISFLKFRSDLVDGKSARAEQDHTATLTETLECPMLAAAQQTDMGNDYRRRVKGHLNRLEETRE